jgi:hypothetical protein
MHAKEMASFSRRLHAARLLFFACFASGFAIAVWNPHPRYVLTAAVAIVAGMLLLGPYTAATIYSLRIQRLFAGYLRWPACILLALSVVYLLNYQLHWSRPQFLLAALPALIGAVMGHDATLAVLELRNSPRLDSWMVLFFPLFVGIAILAGYSSLGFFSGTYQFVAAVLG